MDHLDDAVSIDIEVAPTVLKLALGEILEATMDPGGTAVASHGSGHQGSRWHTKGPFHPALGKRLANDPGNDHQYRCETHHGD